MLENTMYKLKNEKKLNVGYFGGSVTFGACASDRDKTSWRALTTKFLKEQFKDANITAQNAAISGTGTGYALFRMEEDLLKYNPDLVFIEFSLNDIYQQYSVEESVWFYEMVLRRIYEHNKNVDIIMAFITDRTYVGGTYKTKDAHEKLAAHYGIPTVDFGAALDAELKRTGNDIGMYIADWVHPTDAGYKVYADEMQRFLLSNLVAGEEMTAKELPKPISKNLKIGKVTTRLPEKDNTIILKGYTGDNSAWGGTLCPNWSKNAGDECILEFDGTYIGAWIESRPKGEAPENLVAEIDGKIYGPFCCIKHDCSLIHITMARDLTDTHHTVKIINRDGGKYRLVKIFTA